MAQRKVFLYRLFKKEFSKRTKELKKAYEKGDMYKTICYLKYLSSFYYQINCKLTDDLLEDITHHVSNDLLGATLIEQSDDRTVFFYDNFGLAARGLANIYVNALVKLGYRVVWVLYEYAEDLDEIKSIYSNRDDITFEIIPKRSIIERMHILQRIIKEYMPKYIFVYTTPEDVAGVGVMSTIRGDTTRFLIDLTDHAFWLGKCAVDYVIGFRNNSYNVSVKYRGIQRDKVLILPYYPEGRKRYEFTGMPFDVREHEFIFSGGSLYKIEGDTVYEEIVAYILENYPDLYFVYAGNGKSKKLNSIKKKFPNRFFQINERKDLDEVLKRAKFYLSTYPMSGALMAQYALQNNCIPLSLAKKKGDLADVATWFLHPKKVNFVFYNKKELLVEIDKLMTDEEYLKNARKELVDQIISEEEFTKQLSLLIKEKRTVFKGKLKKIDIRDFLDTYRQRASYEQYCNIIYFSHNQWIWKKHPLIVKHMRRKDNRKLV